jgi:hypothetical protein
MVQFEGDGWPAIADGAGDAVLPKEQRLFELFYKNTVITHVNGER